MFALSVSVDPVLSELSSLFYPRTEQQGVDPDIELDNDPRMTFDGKDAQLERAIDELKTWLKKEPVVIPKPPAKKPDKSLPAVSCPATR